MYIGDNMQRKILNELIKWKDKKDRMPLIIHGARQIGKSYIMEELFAKHYYEDYLLINFEKDEVVVEEFNKTINPEIIIEKLEFIFRKQIIPGKTLLIFDEIQASEKALTSLKYFCENKPEYHVIAAGSLLGVAINREKYSFPVGKVDMITMYPMDFEEFLLATDNELLIKKVKECYKENKKMDATAHEILLDLYKRYLVIGGMPAAIKHYKETGKLLGIDEYHSRIVLEYVKDMSKYASKSDSIRIQATYNSIPTQLAKDNRKFQYKIVKKGGTASMYELPLEWLNSAGLILKCNKVEDARHPLNVYTDLTYFKVYASDTGLLMLKAGLSITSVFENEHNVFKGPLIENYVACALTSNNFNLKYWISKNTSEVDFLVEKENKVIPIEVKANDHIKSRSLTNYINKYNPIYAIRISTKNFGFVNNIKSVPLYAVFCITSENL